MRIAALMTLCAAAMWMLSTAGCAPGEPKTTEQQPVLYVRAGYVLPPTLPNLARIPDEQQRLEMLRAVAVPIEDRWLVDGPTMRWMLKQIARLKRLEREGHIGTP